MMTFNSLKVTALTKKNKKTTKKTQPASKN